MFNDIYLQADCTNASIASRRSLRTGINVIRGETANKPSLVPDFFENKNFLLRAELLSYFPKDWMCMSMNVKLLLAFKI